MPSVRRAVERPFMDSVKQMVPFSFWNVPWVFCCAILVLITWNASSYAQSIEEADDPDASENFTRSAKVKTSPSLNRHFRQVADAIDNGNETLAANLLRDVLATDEKGYLEWSGTYHWSSSLAEEMISNLSPAGRQAYFRRSKTASERALQAARDADDPVQLQEVADQYRLTPAGRTALRESMNLFYDRGELTRAKILSDYLAGKTALQTEAVQNVADVLFAPIDSPGDGWSYKFRLPDHAVQMIESGIIDLYENGAVPYLKPEWVRTNHGIVVKTPTGIVSLDPSTGKEQWSDLHDDPVTEMLLKEKAWGTNTELIIKKMLLRRTFDETASSTLSTDRHRIYSVQPLPMKKELDGIFSLAVNQGKQDDKDQSLIDFPSGQLTCHHAETGEVTWASKQSQAFLTMFAGAPAISGDLLYTFTETSNLDVSSLQVYDSTSREVEQEILATYSLYPINKDRRRYQAACPLTLTPRYVYCPTGAGALVAVDRVFETVAWVSRYPRTDARQSGASMGQPDPDLDGYQWWLNWQIPQTIVQGNLLVFASPESSSLMVLDRRTGRILWSQSMPDAQSISAVDAKQVVVASQRGVASYSLKTGEQLWSRATPLIAGTGYLHAGTLTLPIQATGRIRLKLDDGSVIFEQRDNSRSAETPPQHHRGMLEPFAPRNLKRLGNYEWVYRLDRLDVRPVDDTPVSRDRFADLAAVIRDQNRNGLCRSLEVPNLDKEGIASLLMSQIIEVARQAEWGTAREPFQQLVLRHLSGSELQGEWFDDLATNAIEQSQWGTVLRLLVDDQNQPLLDEMVPIPEEERQCLRGRFILGRLQHQLQSATAVEQQRFTMAWSTLNSEERQRLNSIGFQSASMPAVDDATDRHHVADAADKPVEKKPFVWPAAAPSVKENTFRFAGGQLLSFNIDCQHESLFDRIQVELDYPASQAIRFSSSEASRPWYCYLPKTNRLLRYEHDLVRAWGLKEMLIMQFGSEVYGIRPFDDRGRTRASLIWPPRKQNIDTLGDRPNQMLSFFRVHPAKRPGFVDRQFWRLDGFLHRATAVGPVQENYFCIQQKGMIIAFDSKTGTELWRRYDLPEKAMTLGDEEQIALIANKTGHVTILSAVDGRILRQQTVPFRKNDILLENGFTVIIAKNEERSLSEIDPLVEQFQKIAEELGGDVESPDDDVPNSDETKPTPPDPEQAEPKDDQQQSSNPIVLTSHHVLDGTVQWKRSHVAGSVPFEIDQRWMGVYEPDGTMLIIDQQSGKPVAKHKVVVEKKVERIACVQMADRLLIAISGPVTEQRLRTARQWRSGTRRPLINGHLYALSRETGAMLWHREFPNTVLPIDQPRDLPIFVTAVAITPENSKNKETPESQLHVYDVRSGAELFSHKSKNGSAIYYSVTPRPGELAIDVATKELAVRFEYAAPAPSNELDHEHSSPKGTNNVDP